MKANSAKAAVSSGAKRDRTATIRENTVKRKDDMLKSIKTIYRLAKRLDEKGVGSPEVDDMILECEQYLTHEECEGDI